MELSNAGIVSTDRRQFPRFYLLANNWKVRNILYVPAPCKHPDKETARNLMVAYVAGNLALAEKCDFGTHCLACEECRSTLAVILSLLGPNISEEEEKTSTLLYAIGVTAASMARSVAKIEALRAA